MYQKGLKAEDDFAFVTNFGRDRTETISFFRLRHSMGALVFCFTNSLDEDAPGFNIFSPGFLKEE